MKDARHERRYISLKSTCTKRCGGRLWLRSYSGLETGKGRREAIDVSNLAYRIERVSSRCCCCCCGGGHCGSRGSDSGRSEWLDDPVAMTFSLVMVVMVVVKSCPFRRRGQDDVRRGLNVYGGMEVVVVTALCGSGSCSGGCSGSSGSSGIMFWPVLSIW